MWDTFWTDRGHPWEFDPGPPKIAMPKWAFTLKPTARSASEKAAVESLRA